MGIKWVELPLEECMEKIIDYRGKTPKKTSSGIPLVTAKIVKNGRIDYSLNPEFIAEEDYEEWMRRGLPKAGDVVMTTEAPMGEVAQLDDRKVALAQRLITLRGNPKIIDNTFLKFLLSSHLIQGRLRARESGTTVTGIKQRELRKILLPLPPLPTQERIADILGSLDDKIDLNRQMNATLEAMARAIFKSWFVNFDPVYARMEGRDYPLPAEIMDLFPDELVDTELGLIPQGWEVGRICDLAEITIGGDWGSDTTKPNSIEVSNLRGVDLMNLRSEGSANPPSRWIKQTSFEKRKLDNCDVIIAISGLGPLGRSLWMNEQLLNRYNRLVTYSNFTKRLKAKTPIHAVYLDRVLFGLHKNRRVWDYSTGTSVPNLDLSGLITQESIILPCEELMKHYYKIVLPIINKLFSEENGILTQIRDTLLPRLMSGEIEV